MAEIFLFDTNIITDFYNGIEEAVDLIAEVKLQKAAISVVTFTEILVGFDDVSQEKDFEIFVEQFLYFSIERSTAKIAAQLRKEYRLELPDAFQAAIAVEHKLTLLTRNTKDFNPSAHKFVKIPYKLRS